MLDKAGVAHLAPESCLAHLGVLNETKVLNLVAHHFIVDLIHLTICGVVIIGYVVMRLDASNKELLILLKTFNQLVH